MKTWQCTICKYIHKGEEPPEKCPICGADASKFVEIDPEKDATEESKNKLEKKPEAKAIKEPEKKSDKKPEKLAFRQTIESLLVKHHIHPISVHTPNGVLPMAVILYLLAWIFEMHLFAQTAMISQIFVVLSLPVVIFTGTLEWRQKYKAAMTMIFKLKIFAAALTCVTCVITLVWYLADPKVLTTPQAWVFILINLLMMMFAGIAGHIGGKLVFKD